MATWRVRYAVPGGKTFQTTVELDVDTAKEARDKILDGDYDLVVAAAALVTVQKVKVAKD